MARSPKKIVTPKEPRIAVTPEAGIAPLCARHHVVYGNAQNAVPGSLFVPVSEVERNEILKLEAGAEHNDSEILLA